MGGRILIVDTDDLFRHNLAVRLRKERFKVHETGDASSMSSMLRFRDIDVVLLGLSGLREAGLVLLQEVRRLRPTTKVILLRDVDQIGLSIAGMKFGAYDDLQMPFDLAALVARIQDACQERRATRRSPIRRLEQLMAAISFAEAGEHDTALHMLSETRTDGSKEPSDKGPARKSNRP